MSLCESCATNCALATQLVNGFGASDDSSADDDSPDEVQTKLRRAHADRVAALLPFPCGACRGRVAGRIAAANRRLAFAKDAPRHSAAAGLVSGLVSSAALALFAAAEAIALLAHAAAAIAPLSLRAETRLLHSWIPANPVHVSVWLIVLSPLLIANPLAPLLNSSAFYNYNPVIVDHPHHHQTDEFEYKGDISWVRDNSVVFLKWKRRRRTKAWFGNSSAVSQRDRGGTGSLVRIRLQKARYLSVQAVLLALRLFAIRVFSFSHNVKAFALYHVAFFIAHILGLWLLKTCFIFSVIGGGTDSQESSMALTASPRKIPSTPMDTPTLKQRFINRPDTSLTGLFLRKRIPPLSIEPSENDSSHHAWSPEKGDELELDGLEFAFANSLTPSKTAGTPISRRSSAMASSRRQTLMHQQLSPIKGGGGDSSVLPDMELVEAEYSAWFKRIQRFQYTSLFFLAVSVVSLGFIYFSDDVVSQAPTALIHTTSRVLGVLFTILWRKDFINWKDEDVSTNRVLQSLAFYFACTLNLSIAYCHLYGTVAARWIPDNYYHPTASSVPIWAGREFLQVFEIDLVKLGWWVIVVGDLCLLVGGCVASSRYSPFL